MHHAAKHFGKPKVDRRNHAKDRSDAHHQVKVRGHEVSIVEKEIQRCLPEHQPGNTARDEHRNKTDGKQHRCGETNPCAP